jgi:hypothetical protein
VHRVEPAGWRATTPATSSYPITVGSAQSAGPLLFGELHLPTVSGTVYDDADGNGARDATEPGLAGRTVYADLNHNGVRDFTTLTFNFPGLPANVQDAAFLVQVPSQGVLEIADVNVPISFSGANPGIALAGPAGASDLVRFRSPPDQISFDGTFDDEAGAPFPFFGGGGNVKPAEPLSVFDGTEPAGKWYLRVQANPQPFGGAAMEQIRVKGLTALHLPGHARAGVPAPPNTVNTLRFVFNQYLGTHYPMLRSASYPEGDLPYQWDEMRVR